MVCTFRFASPLLCQQSLLCESIKKRSTVTKGPYFQSGDLFIAHIRHTKHTNWFNFLAEYKTSFLAIFSSCYLGGEGWRSEFPIHQLRAGPLTSEWIQFKKNKSWFQMIQYEIWGNDGVGSQIYFSYMEVMSWCCC